MKKIMFNDKYGLTQAVLDGRKTQTRRLVKEETPLGNWDKTLKYSRYQVGEVVAIAQSYQDIMNESVRTCYIPNWSFADDHCEEAGWNNKLFVRSDLMRHHIKITSVRIERLQEISDEDCLREGLLECKSDPNLYYFRWDTENAIHKRLHTNIRSLYSVFIDKINGKGTWNSNPYVWVYSLILVD